MYIVNLRYGTPNRNAFYLQKSSVLFCDPLLLHIKGIKQAVIVELNFNQKSVIVEQNVYNID